MPNSHRLVLTLSCVFCWTLLGAFAAHAQTVTATLGVGTRPQSVAVNPVTNKIYVANVGGKNVTVIDGATNFTTTVNAGTQPSSIGVNPVTNKIYVANAISNNVTVIEGASNNTVNVTTGSSLFQSL